MHLFSPKYQCNFIKQISALVAVLIQLCWINLVSVIMWSMLRKSLISGPLSSSQSWCCSITWICKVCCKSDWKFPFFLCVLLFCRFQLKSTKYPWKQIECMILQNERYVYFILHCRHHIGTVIITVSILDKLS